MLLLGFITLCGAFFLLLVLYSPLQLTPLLLHCTPQNSKPSRKFTHISITDWNAAVLVLRYWIPEETFPFWAWCLIFWVVFSLMTTLGVRIYGELEYIFGMFKFLALIVLFFVSILANVGAFGHGYVGFKYWKAPTGMFDYSII